MGMIGAAHYLPGIAMIVNVAPPGQRFIAHLDAALLRPRAQFPEIGRRTVDTTKRRRRNIGTDQHQIGAQFAHKVEFRSARSNVRLRWGSGMPSKSRKGWNSVSASP